MFSFSPARPKELTADMLGPKTNLLSDELLSQLTSRGNAKTYARNESVIVEGDVSDALFILVSGQLKVFTRDSKGRELIYNTLQPGELFGELFLDGGARSASVMAIVDSQCITVDHLDIRDFIRAYPEFAEFLIYSLINRLRHATELSKGLALHDVYERTVALLNQTAVNEGQTRVVPSAMTQQGIADRVGATREMINHIIRALMRGGFLIRDEKRRLVFKKSLPARW
jgi:CRP/FNR family cyclic AMP-dependent transcriptional regulator